MINREKAISLIKEKCDFALQRHLHHVAVAMERLAEHLGHEQEKEKWFLTGLLHDIDWNETIKNPTKHCGDETMDFLKANGVDEEIRLAIKSHYHIHNVPRDNDLRKALFVVDEISGFTVAVALLRPTKMIGIKAKSIIKKIKDKSFAAAVSREDMKSCEAYFNLSQSELLSLLIPAFEAIAPEWELS